jgi:hypothetical protein
MRKTLEPQISSTCVIKDKHCIVNGKLLFAGHETDSDNEFINNLYRHMELAYPKFFKMDLLCKTGLLAAETLISNLNENAKSELCILFTNNASSLETDRKHISNIKDPEAYFPSPSVFVYTLPNIVIGEISIRHKIMGEGVFFLSESHNFEWLKEYAKILINTGVTSKVLLGYLDADHECCEARLILLER